MDEEDHCLCVLLYAKGGPAFEHPKTKPSNLMAGGDAAAAVSSDDPLALPPPQPHTHTHTHPSSSPSPSPSPLPPNAPSKTRKVSLFSGYVPYAHLRRAVEQQRRGHVSGFLGYKPSWGREGRGGRGGGRGEGREGRGDAPAEKIYMRGPNGVGSAEVAVTALPTPPPAQKQGQAERRGEGEGEGEKEREGEIGGGSGLTEGGGRGSSVRGLLSAAAGSLASGLPWGGGGKSSPRGAEGKGKGKGKEREETPPLRCCLMNVTMAWEPLARDIMRASSA